ncbi:uncharacterized protein LTR77_000050 [Saxophila tyrrhenica]|uniref:BTB domain-containing protein n=1 Tax=Saxophila tyrrhenica TaxID=1690608 RepID=A0AAV9PLX6_9PEZI|nr:hypothetical protein LTR77_000050 [Saxophila tyrrhenica]
MADGFDVKAIFDKPEFSDITIKFGAQEVKCHKVVLTQASDYFRTLLTNRNFVESEQATIELQGDEPRAVMAMLRHIYGFPYDQDLAILPSEGIDFHHAVDTTANKYLLSKLEEKALNSLDSSCARYEEACDLLDKVQVFRTIKKFALHKELGGPMDKAYHHILSTQFLALYKLQEFRLWLEEPGKEGVRDMAFELMDNANKNCIGCQVSPCKRCGLTCVVVNKKGNTRGLHCYAGDDCVSRPHTFH